MNLVRSQILGKRLEREILAWLPAAPFLAVTLCSTTSLSTLSTWIKASRFSCQPLNNQILRPIRTALAVGGPHERKQSAWPASVACWREVRDTIASPRDVSRSSLPWLLMNVCFLCHINPIYCCSCLIVHHLSRPLSAWVVVPGGNLYFHLMFVLSRPCTPAGTSKWDFKRNT